MSKLGQHIKHLKRLGNSKIGFLAIALFGLVSACDFAPPPVDFDRTVVETEGELYQLLVDTAMGEAMAGIIAEKCPEFSVNETARVAYRDRLFQAVAEFEREHPDLAARFVERYGSEEGDFRPGPGIASDLVGRILTYFAVRGFPVTEAGMCRAGRAEIRQGTLAGRFLSGMADQPTVVP